MSMQLDSRLRWKVHIKKKLEEFDHNQRCTRISYYETFILQNITTARKKAAEH